MQAEFNQMGSCTSMDIAGTLSQPASVVEYTEYRIWPAPEMYDAWEIAEIELMIEDIYSSDRVDQTVCTDVLNEEH